MTNAPAIDYAELVHDERVGTRLYVDDRVFLDELEHIFSRTWVYVGHDSEVGEANDYLTRTIGRVPVIMARSRDGAIRMFFNRCAHRGNTVCQDEQGNASIYRCAYHGWSYSNTGSLLGATFPDGYGAAFDKATCGLTPVPRVDAYAGFVFGSLAPDGETLTDHLGPAAEYLDQFTNFSPAGRIELRAGAIKSRLRGNWKLPMENAVDGYHPAFLHRSVMVDRGNPDAQVAEATTRSLDLGHGHGALDFRASNRVTLAGATESRVPVIPVVAELEAANAEHCARLEARHGHDHGRRIFGDGLSNVSIFPNLALVRGDVRFVVPVAVDETLLYQFPAVFAGAPEVVNRERIRWEVAAYGAMGMVGSDDAEAYERTQAGLHAGLDDWVLLSRGLEREVDDGRVRASELTDETSQRAFWREYRRRMIAAR